MNHHLASNLAAIDDRLRSIDDSATRAVLERWLLTFACAHSRFRLDEALLLGWQWALRCGFDCIARSGEEPWCAHPMPATATEWSADGGLINPDSLPLVLPGEDGEVTEYHVLYDTVTVEEDHSGAFDSYPEVVPLPAHPLAHDYGEFDGLLVDDERTMLSHLWRLGLSVEWGTRQTGSVTWVEDGVGDLNFPPYPGMHGRQAFKRLFIHIDTEGWDVMTLVLRHLAERAWMAVLERHLGHEVDVPITNVSIPLELGLAVEVTRQRVCAGESYANMDAYRYLGEDTTPPAPPELRWWLIYEVAQLMEDLLLGRGSYLWSAPDDGDDEYEELEEVQDEDPDTTDTADTDDTDDEEAAVVFSEPLRHLDRLMWEVPVDEDHEVACWLRDFVRDNPRFTPSQAVALGWQLWERFGEMHISDPEFRGSTRELDLRSVDDWAGRGRAAAEGARPLYAPGPDEETLTFLLAEDTEIVDTVADFFAGLGEDEGNDNDYYHHRAPAEGTPELDSLHGHVTDYELALLRNVTRFHIHVEMAGWDVYDDDDLAPWGGDDNGTYLPVIATQECTVMRMAMNRVVNVVMAHLLGDLGDTHIVNGRFEVDCSLLEEELAVLICAHRLGLEEAPDSDEASDFFLADIAPDDVRWGLVYLAAAHLETLLRGYRWNEVD